MQMDHTSAGPMRAYLLGLLAHDEAAALEEQYFVHRSVLLQVYAEERMLIADYLEDRLGPREKLQFESRYLAIPELQQKVEEVRRQRNALRPVAARSKRALYPLAAAAAFLLVIGLGLGLWSVYFRKADTHSVAREQLKKNPEENQLPTPPVQDENRSEADGAVVKISENDPLIISDSPVFIASGRYYLADYEKKCAISSGDILLRVTNVPDPEDLVDVKVIKSKPGNCPIDSYSLIAVGDLDEMRNHFRKKLQAEMQKQQMQASVKTHFPALPASLPAFVPATASKNDNSAPPSNANLAATNTGSPLPSGIANPGTVPDSSINAAPPSSTLFPSFEEQLQNKYTMAQGINGCNIYNPESALITQSPGGGIRVLPGSSSNMIIAKCTNTFADGKLKPANSACNGSGVAKAGGFLSHIPKVGGALGAGSSNVNDHAANQEMDVVATGDKIYPTNLEVNESKGEVKFTFTTCKQPGDQANPYKGTVIFHFDNLQTENLAQVQDTIEQVFKKGVNGSNLGNQQNPSLQLQSNHQSSTCSVEIGQTMAEVESKCGKPENQSRGATKILYFYNRSRIKVVFVNGKVSDIE